MEAHQYFCSMNSVMYVCVDCDKSSQAKDLVFQIIKTIGKFERKWNCFDKRSTISKLNRRKERWSFVEKPTLEVLKKSYEYSNESGGNYSLFSGVYAHLWKEAILSESIPSSDGIKKLMEKQKRADLSFKWRFVKPNDSNLIDLGGCAKGFIAQYIKINMKI